MTRGNRTPSRTGAAWTPRIIAAALREKGWSQGELARHLGVSRTTLRRALGLEKDPFDSDHTARRREFAALLEVPYTDLAAAWTKAAA